MNRSTAARSWTQVLLIAAITGIGVAGTDAQEGREVTGASTPWVSPIQKVDTALSRKEFSAALRASQEAYAAAVASRRWEGLIAAGDAYRRVGEATELHKSFDAKAREAYRSALFRARQQGSVEGALRAAEAFLTLGDSEVVAQCVRIAERLAGTDPEARADVRAFAARLGDPSLTVEQSRR